MTAQKTKKAITDHPITLTCEILTSVNTENVDNCIPKIQIAQETERDSKLTAKLIKDKLAAARSRGEFRSVDLFAGCGGLSLGFDRAGFRSICGVELNDFARKSHELNFGTGIHANTYRAFADIKKTEPEDAVAHIGSKSTEFAADVVIGGPPCQAFSRLGRAALWNLAGEKFAHEHDERATMYHYFLHYVATLKPLAFVMENVREIGKHVGKNIAEEIAVTADAMGYTTSYTLLNAVWFGVPQLRERMFIIGIHKSLKKMPVFPAIQFGYELPVGYSTSRSGDGAPEVCLPCDHYIDHCEKATNLRQATSVSMAFADLPPIVHHLDGRKGKGVPRRVFDQIAYGPKNNWFTEEMRSWPRFENGSGSFTGHVIRYTPRDYEIFRRMPHGGMYPEALIVAEEIFQERLESFERETGKKVIPGTEDWEILRKATVPPYKEGRYPNKFRKMWPDHPSRTLPAHIGKDSYSHIHFDSDQARGISLREAARIQSFPDAFKLAGSMNSQLAQIGNAVPPLLAYAVAQEVRRALIG
jgi:DNA (cytosine-5)-methyltransferase 1